MPVSVQQKCLSNLEPGELQKNQFEGLRILVVFRGQAQRKDRDFKYVNSLQNMNEAVVQDLQRCGTASFICSEFPYLKSLSFL
jgi:hypothetical protein